MPELKVEEAKKELEGIVGKEKDSAQRAKESLLSKEERESLEAQKQEEKKKAEEERVKAETQAKKDAEILTKKDEELSDDDKKRKSELLEIKRKEENSKLSGEEKIKKIQEASQKRIDELVNQLKQSEDKTSKETQLLRLELDNLRKEKVDLEAKISKPKEDIESIVLKEEKEKWSKYLQEDSSKPREERREMTKDELDDWILEDQAEAIAWINRRELRRERERLKNLNSKWSELFNKDLFGKQLQSYNRVLVKHPELDTKKRRDELTAQGKTEGEIEEILIKENPKYALTLKIADEHPDWKTREDAPELVIQELEKTLAKDNQSADEKDKQIEDLRKQINDLNAKIDSIVNPPDVGINSTVPRNKPKEGGFSDSEKDIIRIMRDQKVPQASIDAAIKRYRERHTKNA